MISALSVVLLYVGSLFDVLDLSLAALASFAVIFAVIELGGAYPYAIWACVSVLSLLLLPNKFPALIYFLFAGIYPIFKSKFEGFRPLFAWLLKLSAFNSALLLLYLASRFLFMPEDMPFAFDVLFFVLANVTFVLYDVAASKIILLYIVKIRKRLKTDYYIKGEKK